MRKWSAIAIASVVLVLMGAEAATAASWANFLVHPAMRALGLKQGEATLESLTTSQIVLSDVRLSPELTAKRVVVTFKALEVVNGRVETVTIEGADVRARLADDGGIVIEGLPLPNPDAPGAEGASDKAITFPLRQLAMRNSRVALQTSGGLFGAELDVDVDFGAAVTAEGRIALSEGANRATIALKDFRASQNDQAGWEIALAGDVSVAANGAHFDGDLRADARIADAIAARVVLRSPAIALPDGVVLSQAIVEAQGELPKDGAPQGSARLQADEVRGKSWQLRGPRVLVEGTPADMRAEIATADQPDPLRVRLQRGEEDRLQANGKLLVDWIAPLVRAFGLPVYGMGEAVVALAVRAPQGALEAPSTLFERGRLDGVISVNLRDARWGELAAADTFTGRWIVDASQNKARVRLPEGARVEALQLSAAIAEGLPPELRPLLAEPVYLFYGGAELGSPELIAERQPNGDIRAAGSMALRAGNPLFGLRIEGGMQAEIPADGPPRIASDALTLHLVDTQVAAMRASGEVRLTDVEATPSDARANVVVSARTAGAPSKAVAFAQADLDVAGSVRWSEGRLSMAFQPESRARLLGLSGRTVRLTSPVVLRLAKGGSHGLSWASATGALTGDLSFGAIAGAFTAREAGAKAQSLSFALKGLNVGIAPEGTRLRVNDGEVRAPSLPLIADGIRADIRLGSSSNGQKGGQKGELVVSRIRHAAADPFVVPMRLGLSVSGQGDALRFTGKLTDLGQRIAFSVDGVHDLARGSGHASFRAPLLFLPNVLQPSDIFPSARGLILDANADIDFQANARWSAKGLEQSGKLTFAFERLQTAELNLRNAVASVDFASLLPPRTAGPQEITIGKLDVGVPLTLGVIAFDMRAIEDVRLHLRQFDLFGGKVRSDPMMLDPEKLSFSTVLEVSDLDLGQVLAFANFGELQAEGKLAGRIPIMANAGEMLLQDAVLETTEPGRVRYRPAGVSGALEKANQATDLLIQALDDFRFNKVSIRLDERDAEELQVRLHMAGESASSLKHGGVRLDRFPIEININLEGPIRQILSESVDDIANASSITWTEDGS